MEKLKIALFLFFATTLCSFSTLDKNKKPQNWEYIGERGGIEFYWKILNKNEGKIKAKNTTPQRKYVSAKYELTTDSGTLIREGYAEFTYINGYAEDTFPITDWGKGRLDQASHIKLYKIRIE